MREFVEDGIIKVDINEFVPRFIEAHMPIESSIRILCKECHRLYDRNSKKINAEESLTEESSLIEKIVNSQMNKSKALKLVFQQNIQTLTTANTIFSNVVSNLDRWWLEPPNYKFESELNIIVNNSLSNNLHVFRIPANAIPNPAILFKQRNDSYRKDCSDIYIPISDAAFIENKGYDFGNFLIKSIPY